ncbi:MAG: pyrroline-5-carboxylate reductase [Myxococcales bacterium]|nr:pyrroline-5-carboxylate reductase [Myxococcales bacterium]MCB9650786.1 pyrroline-5-carboxylate reductase [Deltaproteobacteria bacterium]
MVLRDKTVAIIGVGNMGLALMRGIIDSGAVPPERIVIHNKRKERTEALAQEYGVRAAESNAACVQGADIVLIAVKPQIFTKVLGEIRGALGDAVVLSVAAGITCARIEAELGGVPRVVRAMPNTPATIKEGATAVCGGAHATELDVEMAQAILQEISEVVVVVDEIHMDAVTGLSGSGPAYIMLIIEAFADAGVKVGLSREIAQALAVQTIRGSARLLQVTNEHPGRLKDQVTSPGGTAIAGLHTLEEGGLRTTIINAVEAATRRAKELGES